MVQHNPEQNISDLLFSGKGMLLVHEGIKLSSSPAL